MPDELPLARERDLLRHEVLRVGNEVRSAVERAVEVFVGRRIDDAFLLALGDRAINRAVRGIESDAYLLLSEQAGSAFQQRFPCAVLRLSIAIERIGDYAASIARATIHLREPPPPSSAAVFLKLRDPAVEILGQALCAFRDQDANLARRAKARAKRLERDYSAMHDALIAGSQTRDVRDVVALSMVMHRIQRATDQAKNICEETLFEVTGQRKARKRYNILFLDKDSAFTAPLAMALAQQAYPNSGAYAFGSPNPSRVPDPRLYRLGEQLGLDFAFVEPQRVALVRDSLEGYHVIIELGDGVHLPVHEVPYSSILLKWPIGGTHAREPALEAQALRERLAALMATLHGDDAD